MRRLTQAELEATHRIFNHVDEVVNYYGPKTLDETAEFVSANRWIMFPVLGITSLREGTGMPVLNVFVSMYGVDDDISDDGSGRAKGWVGLTYNNSSAMAQLYDILRYTRTKGSVLMRSLKSLSDDWKVCVTHKIKTDCHRSTPHYEVFRSEVPSALDFDWLTQALADAEQNKPALGDIYHKTGNPILSCITMCSIEKEISDFDTDVKEIFDIFLRLHALK